MDHEKKLAFVARMTKLGLDHVQHLDSGGTIIPSNPGGNPVLSPTQAAGTAPNTNQGGLSGVFGLGNNFQGASANITPGTNASQLSSAYTGAENAINSQVGTANQLQPLVGAGVGTETALGSQLANEAAGVGPNPAQAALSQSTAQNVGTTAAEIAGARGSNANVGLLTRGAVSQGAATQEQGAASAATLQAQQQIAAQQAEAGLASTEVGQGTGAVTNLNETQQNEQNILQGANTSANNAAVAQQSNINNVNAATAAANQNMQSTVLGGLLSGGATALGLAKGGLVKMDKGGGVLDANARKHIAPHNFALPGGRYPIHDIAHARNALARVSQNGTPAEKAKVKSAVHKKYPSLAGKKMDEGGDVGFDPVDDNDSSPASSTGGEPTLPQNPKPKGLGGAVGALAALLARGGSVSDGYMTAKRMATGGYMAPTPLVVGGNQGPQSFVGQWVNSNITPSNGPSIGNAVSLPDAPSLKGSAGQLGSALKSFLNKPKTVTGAQTGAQAGADAGAPESNPTDGMPSAAGDAADIDGGDLGSDMARGGLAAKGGSVQPRNAKQTPKVPGDSLKNDKIPAMLSGGEVVIDRDTLADKGPLGQMARAVASHIKARNKRNKK